MTLVRTALAAVLVALIAVGSAWVVRNVDDSVRRDRQAEGATDRERRPDTTGTPRRADAVAVLRDWDAARSRAWAEGDTESLGRLYVEESHTGRRDVEMLRQYVRRGLVVEGLTTQVLEVKEVRRGDELLVLDVTDRVSGGTVVGAAVRRSLPSDTMSRREVEMRRRGDVWQVVEVVERSVPARTG